MKPFLRQELFNKETLFQVSDIHPRIGPLLNSYECELPPLTGAALKKKIMSTKKTRAVALDGWRISEPHFLPTKWYDLLAECLMTIEQGVKWPEVCQLATISTIPKGNSDQAALYPGGEIVAGDGLNTRPITNMCPLYTIYSGCRYQHMETWREMWMEPCMHGARAKHEIHDCSLSLAFQMEFQSQINNFSAGVSMDRKKIDLLEYDVGFYLMKQLGAPEGVLQAEIQMYSNLRCSYKVKRAASRFFTKRNGFAQGDSWSLQIALANMATWTKFMKAGPQQNMALHTGSFIDDSHFHCFSDNMQAVANNVSAAWKRSL